MQALLRSGPQAEVLGTAHSLTYPSLLLMPVLLGIRLRATQSLALLLNIQPRPGRQRIFFRRRLRQSDSPMKMPAAAATTTCKPRAPIRAKGPMARILERT